METTENPPKPSKIHSKPTKKRQKNTTNPRKPARNAAAAPRVPRLLPAPQRVRLRCQALGLGHELRAELRLAKLLAARQARLRLEDPQLELPAAASKTAENAAFRRVFRWFSSSFHPFPPVFRPFLTVF